MTYKLPRRHRPDTSPYRQFRPGDDLPYGFFDDVRGIDNRLHFVWHPYQVEYENVMNIYTGKIEDPRFNIHIEYDQEVWGWVLRNPDNSPKEDGSWHIWQIHDHGWSHVCPVLSSDPNYLSTLARRLHLQGKMVDKYGKYAYAKGLTEESEERRQKRLEDLREIEDEVHKENSWLMKRAMENLSRGHINPTNPQKEQIMTYPGQSHRSRVSRPLTDEEGGLIVPGS